LLKSNPENIGTPFMFSKFLDEVAVGAGVGLRIDVSFFILRFDLAMPLRKIPISVDNPQKIPIPGDNFKWVMNDINFGSSAWRNENLLLNIAIGYPF
jgi:outer membrane protein insertion porin family